ncbi:MAG: PIN domain-containing protein [Chloroflexota bacterium]
MGLTTIDASISLATLDSADALHQAAMRAIVDAGESRIVLPAPGLAESLVAAHRRGQASAAREILTELGIDIEPLTEEMADVAARLRATHTSLRLGDALIIATARVLDADQVLTGDRRWAPVWDRVRVIAP